MALLQPKLHLKVTQRQILTPGLVQMVSVLALNKLELKDMINAEMVENPVLEELDSQVPLLDEVAGREEERNPAEAADNQVTEAEHKDPFDEIDFGSFFRDYLDPGYRSPAAEEIEKPSFENFLSRPTTLTDHLLWQLGSLHVSPEVRAAAEAIIGNLDQDGYLTASDEELLGEAEAQPEEVVQPEESRKSRSRRAKVAAEELLAEGIALPGQAEGDSVPDGAEVEGALEEAMSAAAAAVADQGVTVMPLTTVAPSEGESAEEEHRDNVIPFAAATQPAFTREALHEAMALVRSMDPVGVGARDLRECLLAQLHYQQRLQQEHDMDGENAEILADCIAVVDSHLKLVQNKHYKEIARAIGRNQDAVLRACEYLRTLDPRPGLRYNQVETRVIEPDVAFVKHGDEYVVVMNDDDIPQLRLNPAYKRFLSREAAEKDVRTYVKERYKSAIQLIKNIEQRKQTILKVCNAIIRRQRDFLDRGIDELKPMMIKEVAEEIGVHPSTVSRAVANKYVHTSQGVFELRYFFSESVQGPEGGNTSLLILKRRVKKLIEEEDPRRPLTDEQIARILQSQGIQVTRRTVAKYREDMRIPSTHQRRAKD